MTLVFGSLVFCFGQKINEEFFVDTNIFLQCRDLSDLPWDQISTDEHIELIIPRAVQNEIDTLKNSGNSRRAKRARKANSCLREIIRSESECAVIREHDPRVEVIFSPKSFSSSTEPHEPQNALDLSKPDDSIIIELISYRSQYTERDAALLTHDTNPMLTAKRLGVPYTEIPDNWLLGPEPDERDKKLQNLESRLAELESNLPDIAFIPTEEGKNLSEVTATIVSYPPLSNDEIKTFIEEVKTAHPMSRSFDEKSPEHSALAPLAITHRVLSVTHTYETPTPEEIRKYQESEYPKWLSDIREKLVVLPIIFLFEAVK